jgi:nitrogen fixation/metabolism regulation signal transduction histidine kinase
VRRERRLEHLREALGILAAGRPVLDTGERGRGTIGRIATMIEDTSRRMAGDRQRLAMLENLSAWQEAARRHAHEMRTPITGLRLELSRLAETLARRPDAGPDEIAGHLEGAQQELDRLTEFTHRFSSFARLPKPKRVRVDLSALLAEMAEIYHEAWDNLEIRFSPGEITEVEVDRDMIRQVLVNLWDNSAAATAPDPVIVSLVVTRSPERTCVDVADDGPGIAAQVSDRLFQPYTTTRTVGEGIGLGLAISKKILLDHGGDLCLTASSPAGATFRLSLPTPPIEIPARGDSHG